ncbi:hypothetical protein IAD21_03056 [Abditibacteriota bacterium]|nr:hypothetical protein IAD21_03056 [Abditibacteriota bacterium]
MHRTIQIALSSSATDQLLEELNALDGVIGLAVFSGASMKPEGDVVSVQVLNHTTDDVMRAVERAHQNGAQVSVSTAEIASLSDPEYAKNVEYDVDEASWEEMETGLRHQARITANYVALMFLGGAVAAIGLVENPVPQAVAFIASAMIAPGFEPLAKMPLGLVLWRPHLLSRGLLSALYGYLVLVIGAALMFGILRLANISSPEKLARNPEVMALGHPDLPSIAFSIIGGTAGMIMVAAYRRSVIAGPLLLLSIIPAAALIGAGAASASWPLMKQGIERLAIDVAIIWLTGTLVVALKQWLVHKRRPFV